MSSSRSCDCWRNYAACSSECLMDDVPKVRPVMPEEFKAIVIEKNIPIPKRQEAHLSAQMRKMSVGDSFLTEGRTHWKSALRYGKLLKEEVGYEFTSRAEGSTWRIWRIK